MAESNHPTVSSQIILQLVNPERYYVRGNVIDQEEDKYHEFKGHRTIAIENLKVDKTTGARIQTRQQWSKYLCGMLNSGLGGKLYGGILDNGVVSGFMMSQYQIQHVVEQLEEVMMMNNYSKIKLLFRCSLASLLQCRDTCGRWSSSPSLNHLTRRSDCPRR